MKMRQIPMKVIFVMPIWNGSFLPKTQDANTVIRGPNISVQFVVDPANLLPNELEVYADVLEADLDYS